MKKFKLFFTRFLVVLLALQGTVAALTINVSRARAASQDVVINEIMWTGSTVSSSDQWIELYNTTAQAIPLTNWTLTNASSATGGILTIPSGSIPAHGFFLISNFNVGSPSTIVTATPNYFTSQVNFGGGSTGSNTCQTVILSDNVSNPVDAMGCLSSGKFFFPASSATKHSLERNLIIADGTLSSSWHERVNGSASITSAAIAAGNRATPTVANDITMPVDGTVSVTPSSYFDLATGLTANWQGFSDSESGISNYQVGLSDNGTNADIIGFQSVAGNLSSYIFDLSGLGLNENGSYYALVQAANGVNLNSLIVASTPTVYRQTTPPDAFNLSNVVDTPYDNGGSVTVSWESSSADVSNYQVQYQLHGGSWSNPLIANAGLDLTTTVSGLKNSPVSYDFRVMANSFNGTTTVSSNELTGSALDNLPPVINGTKLLITQNAPGTADTVNGAAGSSNEAGTANVYSVDPIANPLALPVGSMPLGSDYSFLPIAIGDNLYSTVWVQISDLSGNKSQAVKLSNDVVAPNAPTLTKVDATCPDACQVKLAWQDNGPDTLSYQIGYTPTDGSEQRSLKVTTTSATLTLNGSTGYDFVIYAFDAAGNVSAKSNLLHAQLVNGVETIVTWVNGASVTTTAALLGAKEVTSANRSALFGATKVQAAEPSATPSGSTPVTPGTGSSTADANKNNSSPSWAKVLVIVALLLIVAGGFYMLSRSYDDKNDQPQPKESKKATPSATKSKSTPRRRRTSRRKR